MAVPSAPVLTVTVMSDRRINLSWTTPANGGFVIREYRINRESPVGGGFSVRSTSPPYDGTPPIIDNSLLINYFDTSVLSSTEYNYTVEARNVDGYSAPSNAANGTTSAAHAASPALKQSLLRG